MDGIAQSESYKRTSPCYLEEGRRLGPAKEMAREGENAEGGGQLDGRTGGKTRYGAMLAKKRANHSTDSPLDLATRAGQERVRILDRHRKEERKGRDAARGRGSGTLTRIRAREKLDSRWSRVARRGGGEYLLFPPLQGVTIGGTSCGTSFYIAELAIGRRTATNPKDGGQNEVSQFEKLSRVRHPARR